MFTNDKKIPAGTRPERFLQRFIIYQKERFPFLSHGMLISVFSFSAISYSRICRGAAGFIPVPIFLAGICVTISLFFLLRILDEFKDAEDDARFRSHLPVPRGLITLRELAWLGGFAVICQLLINTIVFPAMLGLYFMVITYLYLMTKEFFSPAWLKKHQFWYVVSHMIIIPLVDIYASGLDWYLSGEKAPSGLIFFFMVSFMNGVVLEIGRKIKFSDDEEFNTYSTMLGPVKATYLWMSMLVITWLCSIAASWFAGYSALSFAILTLCLVLSIIPGFTFIKNASRTASKRIEYSSGIWTICMYLTLGGVPMLSKII